MKIQITYDGRTRTIGEIQTDTFYKRVQGSKHKHFKTNSWAIDQEAFKEKIATQVDLICISDTETGHDYWTTPLMYNEFGFHLQHGNHRLQIFLTLKYFATSAQAARDAANKLEEEKESENPQQQLF